jgi:putative peptide zinc metalloprotease protein
VRAAGVELIGQMRGSGYRVPPSLVRRADGQTLQLTKLLYVVLEAIDGHRTYEQVADEVSTAVGRTLAPDDARMLIDTKLRPLGLVCGPDGSEPDVRKSNPLLALRFRLVVSNPEMTRRITRPFAWLFQPLIVIAALVAFVLVCKWVLFEEGLAFAAHQAFASPGMLLTVFAITLLSAGFHEFGHAAGARYGGATPGAMGAGLYLVWPAFYTDVTDSYRLGRGGRLRTDLGGLYFNALLSVAMFGAWWMTGWDALLLVIATQLIQMVRQLPPLIRFDGYHILADLTGVPDLFHRIRPTITGMWPTRWGDAESKALKPWAKAVVTLWVLLVVPLMILTVLVTVLTMPRIVASSAASLSHQWSLMVHRFGDGDVLGGLARVLGVIAVALPLFGIAYITVRSLRRLASTVLRATEGRPGRRALAGVIAAAVLAGLVYVWWPHGNYRPIRAYERGTIQSLLPVSYRADAAGLAEGQQASAQTIWPANAGPPPTADHPVLSLVLVPRGKTTEGKAAPTWVFPFNRPAPPGIGDNQALAVNTTDGTAVYDVAFALVWADGDTVLNKNEAYAFASCSHCTTTAISFQVVAIVGHADIVVPQNLSGALNYDCVSCVTRALAVQLVVTLPAQPSAAETKELDALWQQIRAFGAHVAGLSYQEIHDRIVGYEEQLLGIVQKYAKPAAPADNTAPSSAPSTSATSGGPNSSTSAGNSVAPTTSSAATSSAPPTQSSSSATSSATSSAPSTSAATSSEPPTVSGTP